MIITVTMNPAIDKTIIVDTISLGGLNRIHDVIIDAGGKGVNVSKTIAALGGKSIAMGFLGGSTGRDIETALHTLGVETDFLKVSRATRTNLKIVCNDYGITEFNEPGTQVSLDEMNALEEKLIGYARPGTIFVLSGSLPNGADSSTYQRIIEVLKGKGASVFLDADGEAFKLAVAAKPDFIKPNMHEIIQYTGKDRVYTIPELAVLCENFIDMGVKSVVLSMGAGGALFVSQNEKTLYSPALKVDACSTVGAGDSMVGAAAYAQEKGMSGKDAAALAMAVSAGTVTTRGTKPPEGEVIEGLLKQAMFVIKELLCYNDGRRREH